MARPEPRRIFTFDEARKLVPVLRERTREALQKLGQLETGSDEDDPEEARAAAERAAADVLGAWARDIQELGIEVKGPWLVDFVSGAGYYCWKWPEQSLEFFHGYEEGFAGRMRLQ